MSSSLAQQLSKLQQNQSVARSLDKNCTFSLLFDFKTANAFPIDTIYSLGYSGFQSLLKNDASFSVFADRFFPGPVLTKQIIRENMLENENKEFHEELQNFILRLSCYFLQENAKKVLEYLIKVFEIHRYEGEDLIVAFMGYHRTTEYMKLIQNINLSQITQWAFLEEIAKTGENKLDRQVLVRRVEENPVVFETMTKCDLRIWGLLLHGNEETKVFSLKEKKLKVGDKIEIQLFHRFLVALIFDCLRASRKLRGNQAFINILLNYIGDIARIREVLTSGLMLFTEILEKNVNINRKIIEAFVKDVIEKSAVETQENISKIFEFILYLSQRNEFPENLWVSLSKLIEQKPEVFSSLISSKGYDLRRFFLSFYSEELKRKSLKNLPFLHETLSRTSKKDRKNEFLIGYHKEITDRFFQELLKGHDLDYFLEIYQKVLHSTLSSELVEGLYQRLNNPAEKPIIQQFLDCLASGDFLPLENFGFDHKESGFSINIGLFSEDHQLRMQAVDKLEELLKKKPEKLTDATEKLLLISLRNDKTLDLLEKVLGILSLGNETEGEIEILEISLEILRAEGVKNEGFAKKMGTYLGRITQIQNKNVQKVSLIFAIVARNIEFLSYFEQPLKALSDSSSLFSFKESPRLSEKNFYKRFEPSKSDDFIQFLDMLFLHDSFIAVSLLSQMTSFPVQKKLEYMIKNKKKLMKIDKKPIYSSLVELMAEENEEKLAIYSLILSDPEPGTISYLSPLANDLKFLATLLTTQPEYQSPIETELKNIKILVFILKKLNEKDCEISKSPEIFPIFLLIFLLSIQAPSGPEVRRLWLEVLETLRRLFRKDNRVATLKGLNGVFRKAAFDLSGFGLKMARKIVKSLLKVKVLLVQNGENINKVKDWVHLNPLILFLAYNLPVFKDHALALAFLSLISKRSDIEFVESKEFKSGLKSKSLLTPEFYHYFLHFNLNFGELNSNFTEILDFSKEKLHEDPAYFEVFISSLADIQEKNGFFSLLTEANQSNLLEILLKQKNQAKILEFIDKLAPESGLVSSMLTNLVEKHDYNAINSLLMLISRRNLISVDIYKEVQAFVAKFVEKNVNSPQKTPLLLISFKVLNSNLQTILENKTILFDFQRKFSPKEYQVHIEDLMGPFLAEKQSYKNLETAVKVLRENMNYTENLEKFSLAFDVLEFIALLAKVSFKTVSKMIEKVFMAIKTETDEQIDNVKELLGFLVRKLVLANPKLTKKIAQFLVISLKCVFKKLRKQRKNMRELLEKELESLISTYQTENLECLIIIFLSMVSQEKELDAGGIIETFATFILKNTEIKAIIISGDQALAFLRIFLERLNLTGKQIAKQEKNLEFLRRKLFPKSKKARKIAVFQSFFVFLQFLLKSPLFHRVLTRKIREFVSFESELASFFSRLFTLDQYFSKFLKKVPLARKKALISVFSNKKSVKSVAKLLESTLDYLHGLFSVDILLKIIANVIAAHSQNPDFKAFVLKTLRIRVLQNNEIAKKIPVAAKESLILEISNGIFANKSIEKQLRERKSLSYLRISLMLASELIGEMGLSGLEKLEIDLKQGFLLLESDKKDIAGLYLVFLSRLSGKSSRFLEEILLKIDEIMNKILELMDDSEENQTARDLALVALNSLVVNLDLLLNPFFGKIENALFRSSSPKSAEVLINLAAKNPAKNLLKPLFLLFDDLSHYDLNKISVFLRKILAGIEPTDFQDLSTELHKILLKMLDFSKTAIIDQEAELDWERLATLEVGVCECYGEFAVKCNEIQLKKFFLQTVNWSEKKQDVDSVGFRFPYYRKIVFYRLSLKIFERLGSFFVGFFSYFFESTLGLITEAEKTFKDATKKSSVSGKRKRETPEEHYKLFIRLVEMILESLIKLFHSDKEEFIDNQKFEKLIETIPSLFELKRADEFEHEFSFERFYQGPLKDLVIALIELVNDDYKWKSLHYNLLLKTRSEDKSVRLAVVSVISQIIDSLKERYVVLISDLMPFLSETLDDRESEIEKVCKEIVVKLEKVSGENIREYLRKV